MEEVDIETGEMHSEEDKEALSDKNKKRKLKTRAQIQALEKFYYEHKYPTESMKMEVAISIGLTEKQISGWFCHRRLKDKRSTKVEINASAHKQDLSSGVVVQDSCGSTKQTCHKMLDNREVESGRLTPKLAGNYGIATEGSWGSNSSPRERCNKLQNNLNLVHVRDSRHSVPRFTFDEVVMKHKMGPSGYLKVKGRVENPAITEVKKRLGNNYIINGPPLAVDFDILPTHAFESSMQDTDGDDETYYTEELILPTSHHPSRLRQIQKSVEGHEYNSCDETRFKAKREYDATNRFSRLENDTNVNPLVKSAEGCSVRDVHSIRNKEEYKVRRIPDDSKVERMRFYNDQYPQTIVEVRKTKLIGKGTKILREDDTEKEYAYSVGMKAKQYDDSGDKVPLRQVSERRVKMRNDFNFQEMKWDEEFTPKQHSKRLPEPYTRRLDRFEQEIRPCFDEGSERSSSID